MLEYCGLWWGSGNYMGCWIQLNEAERALTEGTGRGIKIAVIDSGLESSHPLLAGLKIAEDIAIVDNGVKLGIANSDGDVFGHGTAVSGIIKGLAPEAEIGSIRVLGRNNASRTAIIQLGAQEAISRGYDILNCSFGCAVEAQVLNYKAWVDEAYLRGVHVVAACNNDDFRTPEWPAFFSSVLAVNMARTDDESIFFYLRGTMVEFAARGVDVTVAWRGGAKKLVTGSSFAAPRISALLARLLSVYPDLSPLQAKSILHAIAKPWVEEVTLQNIASIDD
jgi:subtilisin family serine protease